MIKLGDNNITLYIGDQQVVAAYLGSDKIYPNSSLALSASTLSFEAAGSSATLDIIVEEDQSWSVTGIPSGWEATATSGVSSTSITIKASNNTSEDIISSTLTVSSDDLSSTCTLTQAAGTKIYEIPHVTAFGYPDIPASGGWVYPNVYEYEQIYTWNGVEGSGGVITTGGTIYYSGWDGGVPGGSLETTETARTAVYTMYTRVDMNGVMGENATCVVYQQANTIIGTSISGGETTYGDITVGAITNATIPASGGSANSIAGNGSQPWSKTETITTYTYTSGSTKSVVTTDATSGTISVAPNASSLSGSATSKGTVVSDVTVVNSGTITWSANGKSATASIYVYQAANAATTITYGTPSVTVSYSDIPAAGGTVYPSVSYSQPRTQNYTSGATAALSVQTTEGTITYSGATNNTNGSVTAGSRGTTIGARTAITTAVAYVTMNGVTGSGSCAVYQADNYITSGSEPGTISDQTVASIVIASNPSSISANGGTTTFTAKLQCTTGYSSGSTYTWYSNSGIVATSSNSVFSVSSPGTLQSDGTTYLFTVSASQSSTTSTRSTTITLRGASAHISSVTKTVPVSQSGQSVGTIKFTDTSGNTITTLNVSTLGLLSTPDLAVVVEETPVTTALGMSTFEFKVVPSNTTLQWMLDAGNGTNISTNCAALTTTDGTNVYTTLAEGNTVYFVGEKTFSGTYVGNIGTSFTLTARMVAGGTAATLTVNGV